MERKIILDFDRKEKSRKHKSSHKGHGTGDGGSGSKKPKTHHYKGNKDQPEQTPSSSQYRDRAQERREGLQKDFELDPENFVVSNPTVDGEESLDEAERRRQQIEDSKYLGGDVEHTHLVMGLDFALAEKIKASEKLSAEKEAKSGDDDGMKFLLGDADLDEEEFLKEALQAGSVTSSGKRQIDIGKLRNSEIIPCRTAMARRILNALDERWPERSEMFLPGRMSYIVPIDEEAGSEVTTVLRSKAEQQETEQSNEKDLAFDQLINIFAKIRKKK